MNLNNPQTVPADLVESLLSLGFEEIEEDAGTLLFSRQDGDQWTDVSVKMEQV